MSGALLGLRVTLVEAHYDSIYRAWLAVIQLEAHDGDPGCTKILKALSKVLDAAYAESEAAA